MSAKIRRLVHVLLNYLQSAEFRLYVRNAPDFIRGRRWAENARNNLPAAGSVAPAASGALFGFFERRSEGRGIQKWVQYFTAYERHLHRFVGLEVTLAEIGIFSGGSLEMWKAYFGGGLSLYGIDIAPETKVYEDDQTRIFIGDQGEGNRYFYRRRQSRSGAPDFHF
jgi:hypothetical protein